MVVSTFTATLKAELLIRTDGLKVPERESLRRQLVSFVAKQETCDALALALASMDPPADLKDRVGLVFAVIACIRLHDRVAQLEAQLAEAQEALVHERSERGDVDLGVRRG